MSKELTIDEVYRAQMVLRDVARHPKIIGPTQLSESCNIYLKPENLQHTGAFKLRGAYYKISQLTDEEKAHGVIACSAGNHAQGVALGATHHGIKSLICLPAGAPISKIEATKRLGAEVCLVPGVYDDAYAKAIELKEKHGYTFVHPFNDPLVIAGQGTIGLEILEEMPRAQAIVVPIGGGGLIAGLAFAVKTLRPDIKVYGVQAAGAPSMAESLKTGKREHLDSVFTIADGIAVKEPGDLTLELCRRYVDEVVTVTDDEIAAAILALVEKQKLVAEGAGAAAVAAAMFGKLPVEGQDVVCVVSGGNIDVNTLNRVINRGLAKAGRVCQFELEVQDKPGILSNVLKVVGDQGANVLSVNHERIGSASQVNSCVLHLELETLNPGHIERIRQALADAGYPVKD
ncbi:MAG: threonine ammonia-lyase [Muribaculaceae bacterium]|nr:threonine ammonia-lyase [Muribaculaceae bacterium]